MTSWRSDGDVDRAIVVQVSRRHPLPATEVPPRAEYSEIRALRDVDCTWTGRRYRTERYEDQAGALSILVDLHLFGADDDIGRSILVNVSKQHGRSDARAEVEALELDVGLRGVCHTGADWTEEPKGRARSNIAIEIRFWSPDEDIRPPVSVDVGHGDAGTEPVSSFACDGYVAILRYLEDYLTGLRGGVRLSGDECSERCEGRYDDHAPHENG